MVGCCEDGRGEGEGEEGWEMHLEFLIVGDGVERG